MTKIIKRRHQMQVVVSYPHPPITVPSIPSFSGYISAPDLQPLKRTSNGTKQHAGQSFLQFSLRFVGRESLSSGKPVHISLTATLQRRLHQDIQEGRYHCYCRGTLSCGPPRDVNAHEDRLGRGRHQAASHAPICTDLGLFFFTKSCFNSFNTVRFLSNA